jgi:hypothetical protein
MENLQSFFAGVFVLIVAAQFGLPFLAHRIKKRYEQLGVPMTSSPNFSMFRGSKFWVEAIRLNELREDPKVTRLLRLYRSWYLLGIVVFVLLVAVTLRH